MTQSMSKFLIYCNLKIERLSVICFLLNIGRPITRNVFTALMVHSLRIHHTHAEFFTHTPHSRWILYAYTTLTLNSLRIHHTHAAFFIRIHHTHVAFFTHTPQSRCILYAYTTLDHAAFFTLTPHPGCIRYAYTTLTLHLRCFFMRNYVRL